MKYNKMGCSASVQTPPKKTIEISEPKQAEPPPIVDRLQRMTTTFNKNAEVDPKTFAHNCWEKLLFALRKIVDDGKTRSLYRNAYTRETARKTVELRLEHFFEERGTDAEVKALWKQYAEPNARVISRTAVERMVEDICQNAVEFIPRVIKEAKICASEIQTRMVSSFEGDPWLRQYREQLNLRTREREDHFAQTVRKLQSPLDREMICHSLCAELALPDGMTEEKLRSETQVLGATLWLPLAHHIAASVFFPWMGSFEAVQGLMDLVVADFVDVFEKWRLTETTAILSAEGHISPIAVDGFIRSYIDSPFKHGQLQPFLDFYASDADMDEPRLESDVVMALQTGDSAFTLDFLVKELSRAIDAFVEALESSRSKHAAAYASSAPARKSQLVALASPTREWLSRLTLEAAKDAVLHHPERQALIESPDWKGLMCLLDQGRRYFGHFVLAPLKEMLQVVLNC